MSAQTGTDGKEHKIIRFEIVLGYVREDTKYSCYFN